VQGRGPPQAVEPVAGRGARGDRPVGGAGDPLSRGGLLLNRDLIVEWLQALGSKPARFDRGYVTTSCPLAAWRHEKGTDRRPSFGVKITMVGESRCHCLSCGFSGKQSELLVVMGALGATGADYARAWLLIERAEEGAGLQLPPVEEEAHTVLHPFSEEWLSHLPSACEIGIARDYLKSRGVGMTQAGMLDFRWDAYRRRVGVPIREYDGTLRGFHGRSVVGEEPAYLMYTWGGHTNPIVWWGEHWINFDEPLVFTESVFDLVAVHRWYGNVTCPLTAGFGTEKLKRVAKADVIVTLFDADKAGDRAREVVEKGAPGSMVTHLYPTSGCKDPGEMAPMAVLQLLQEAGLYVRDLGDP